MLRSILGGFAGIEPVDVNIQKNRFGKPFLTNSKLSFNLSHTNEAFLIGFSKNGRIGIDLEKLSGREELLSLIEYSFSQQESDYCLKGELSICFLEIWTLKEAFLKAAGVGLVDNLKSVNVFGEVANDITRRDLCYSNFLCPNGETASVVYRSGASISFVRADHSEY
jgi:4'-phosphopantetheinyl transferase